MVICELCGKEIRTSQGLRGHKTFVHGFHASYDKQIATLHHRELMEESSNTKDLEKSGAIEYRDRIDKLESEVVSNSASMMELWRIVKELQNELVFVATRSETHRIAKTIDTLRNRLDKHDRWFNPNDNDEVIVGISGGPIAYLKRQLEDHQYTIKSGDKKYRLKPRNPIGYQK